MTVAASTSGEPAAGRRSVALTNPGAAVMFPAPAVTPGVTTPSQRDRAIDAAAVPPPAAVAASAEPGARTLSVSDRVALRPAWGQKAMTAAGFKTKVQPVAVNYIGVGYVVYSKPSAKSEAPKGSTITLYVV